MAVFGEIQAEIDYILDQPKHQSGQRGQQRGVEAAGQCLGPPGKQQIYPRWLQSFLDDGRGYKRPQYAPVQHLFKRCSDQANKTTQDRNKRPKYSPFCRQAISPVTNPDVLIQTEWRILVGEEVGISRNPRAPPKVPGDKVKEALGVLTGEHDSPPGEEHENKSDDVYKPKYDVLRYKQNNPEKCTEP